MLDGESGLNKVKHHARNIVLEVDKRWCFFVHIGREVYTHSNKNTFHIK